MVVRNRNKRLVRKNDAVTNRNHKSHIHTFKEDTMMFKQRCWIAVLLLVLVFTVASCSHDDEGLAPDSVAGQTYQLTATTVAGIYQAGTLTVAFVGNGYAITLQSGVPLDTGTYTYQKSSTDADSATITLNSIGGVVTTCNVTYQNATSGTFNLSTARNTLVVGTAQGTFTKN
jgi:hypothetical protein